jgi:OOP family OmpA-OmpF porin
MRTLYPLVTFLKENPARTVSIEGHTDSIGSESYNLELSEHRADAVRQFLIAQGIEGGRIAAVGYGKVLTTLRPDDNRTDGWRSSCSSREAENWRGKISSAH